MRARRALVGSMIAVALASPFVWSAPASAASVVINSDDVCVSLGSMGVQLLNFRRLDIGGGGTITSATYEVTNGILTIDMTGQAEHFSYAYFPSMSFWSGTDCAGTNELPSGGYRVCVSASSEDGTVGFYSVTQQFGNIYKTEQDISLGQGFTPPLTTFDAVNDRNVALQSIGPFFKQFNFEEDGDGDPIGVLSATFTFGIGVCGGDTPDPEGDDETDDDSRDGLGHDFDIDIDHYRSRAAAEGTALPDTL